MAGSRAIAVRIGPRLLQRSRRRERDIELTAVQLRVVRVVEQNAAGELSVAARAPRLLVVGLRRRRQGPVHHQPDRRLVDAHAEGTGGDHQIEAVVEEGVEDGGAPSPVEAGVIGCGPMPGRHDRAGDRLGEPAGRGVDDGHPVVTVRVVKRNRPKGIHRRRSAFLETNRVLVCAVERLAGFVSRY